MDELWIGDMIGTRARFQRFSDSKIFNGWFKGFSAETFVIHARLIAPIDPGDRFFFQVAALDADVRFIGDFVSVGLGPETRSPEVQIDLSHIGSPEEDEMDMLFKLNGQLQLRPLSEEPRRRIGDRIVTIADQKGAESPALLSDISPSGAGILSSRSFGKGEMITLSLESMQRRMSLQAEVRYSIRSKNVPDMFKSGLKFHGFGRVDEAMWKRFLKAA